MSWLCAVLGHKREDVAYGYPPYKRVWHSIYRCPRCKAYEIVRDDLFAELRPKNWPANQDCMNYKKSIPAGLVEWLPQGRQV